MWLLRLVRFNMKKTLLLIILSSILLSGCTASNSFFYAYEKGDCSSNHFEDIDDDLDLTFQWKNNNLYIRWDEYSGDDFYGYYLVRDETNTCPYYYNGADYREYVSKKITTLYVDDVKSGSDYYYRMCVRQKDRSIDCGSVFKVEIY